MGGVILLQETDTDCLSRMKEVNPETHRLVILIWERVQNRF